MSEIRPFTPQKLVIPAILAGQPDSATGALSERVVEALTEAFGALDYVGRPLPFTFTDYYAPEMGAPLVRRFYAVGELVDPSRLAEIKHRTDLIEGRFLHSRGRSVNLDPGMLSLSRLILASTKDFSHRIPLRDGIYGEVTLTYAKGRFNPLPWTFPDYRSKEYQEILLHIRTVYHRQLRMRPGPAD